MDENMITDNQPEPKPITETPNIQPQKKNSALAILSFIFAIIGICFGPFILPSLIIGIIALVKIKKNRATLKGMGFAIAGVVISIVAIIALVILSIIIIPPLIAAWDSNKDLSYYYKNNYNNDNYTYQAVESDPKDAQAYCNRGMAYEIRGDWDKAMADYNRAIGLDPKYAEAYHKRGLAYHRQGDLYKAMADYNRAIELDPKNVWAYNSRGSTYTEKGDWNEAIADYTKAIELNPKNAGVYSSRGIAYEVKGELNKAIADFERYLELEPNGYLAAQCWRDIEDMRERFERSDEDVTDFSEDIKLDPKDSMAYNSRGLAYKDKGELDKAIADFTKAIELDPKNVYAYLNRAVSYDSKGDWNKAIENYTKVLEINSKDSNAYYGRGLTYRTIDKFKEAIADFERYLELEPGSPYVSRISQNIEEMKKQLGK